MPKFGKRDVLLHFDESLGEIIFYSIDSDSLSELRKKEFGGSRWDIKHLQQQTADEAEQALGSRVFSQLDSFSLQKIGIRDYEALSKKAKLTYLADLEAQAARKDPEALYYLSIERQCTALREKSLANLEEAEKLLKEAAELGNEDAKKRLASDWPLMKKTVLRRIQNGESA